MKWNQKVDRGIHSINPNSCAKRKKKIFDKPDRDEIVLATKKFLRRGGKIEEVSAEVVEDDDRYHPSFTRFGIDVTQ